MMEILEEKHKTTKIKHHSENTTSNSNIQFENAQQIGVVYTTEGPEKHEIIKGFVKKLKEEGKSVQVLTYLPKHEENYEFLFDFFTKKDFSFLGKVKNPHVRNFIATEFDYLFLLDTQYHSVFDKIFSLSKAKCRLGCFRKGKDKLFELMLKEDRDLTTVQLIDKLYRFAKSMK